MENGECHLCHAKIEYKPKLHKKKCYKCSSLLSQKKEKIIPRKQLERENKELKDKIQFLEIELYNKV
jgi:hypothetical protein